MKHLKFVFLTSQTLFSKKSNLFFILTKKASFSHPFFYFPLYSIENTLKSSFRRKSFLSFSDHQFLIKSFSIIYFNKYQPKILFFTVHLFDGSDFSISFFFHPVEVLFFTYWRNSVKSSFSFLFFWMLLQWNHSLFGNSGSYPCLRKKFSLI